MLKVTFDVHANAEIFVSEQNVVKGPDRVVGAKEGEEDVHMEKVNDASERVKRVARALDICGDLGVWGEWLRREALRTN